MTSAIAAVREDAGRVGLIAAALVAALAIAAGATLSPMATVALGVAAVLAVVTVANLAYGVALFTLLTFFETLPGLEGIALSKPFGLVLVVSWLVTLIREAGDAPLLWRERPGLAYLLVLFVGWGGISAVWATDSALAVSSAVRLGLIVVLVFVIFTALRTPRDLAIVAWSYLVGAALVSVVSISTGSNKAGRLALGELDPNTLAASLAAALALALFLLWGTTRAGVRVLLLAFMATYAVSIVLTGSRGGLVASCVAVATAIAVGGPFRARVLGMTLIVVALGVGYYALLAPADVRGHISSSTYNEREPRLDTWAIALQMGEDNPVLGVGLGNFEVVEPTYLADQISLLTARKLQQLTLVAHNTYLEILAELGTVGLALFAVTLLVILLSAVQALRLLGSWAPYASLTTRGLVVTLMTLLTAYFFVSATYAKHLWLLIGVLAAVPCIARTLRAEPEPGSSRAVS